MVNIKSNKQHIIKSKKNHINNISKKSMIRTFLKKTNRAILNNDKVTAKKLYLHLQLILDRQARKGIIHKNKAARHKSNIIKRINNLQ
ncbi:MAG: 30S ribosomal protein S20 [Candidatus Lightella neohaematopini]|nr:30S ribosomal protein S20 [Candidatus Lightella neohaematopini]MCV2531179.1 30S ribosomal protein S20 [Candidatus Lightella neohaematopini]